jgi:hypothetical protein
LVRARLSPFSHHPLSFWLSFITLTLSAHFGQKTHLTNRSSQPLAAPMSSFHITSTLESAATLAPASGG